VFCRESRHNRRAISSLPPALAGRTPAMFDDKLRSFGQMKNHLLKPVTHRRSRARERDAVSFSPIGWCLLAILFPALLPATPLPAADWISEPIPQYDQRFQRTNGW